MSIRKTDFNPLDPSEGIKSMEELLVPEQKGASKTGKLPNQSALTGLLPGQGRPDSALDGLLKHNDHEEKHLLGEGPEVQDPSVLNPNEWVAVAESVTEDLATLSVESATIKDAQHLLCAEEELTERLTDALNALKKG